MFPSTPFDFVDFVPEEGSHVCSLFFETKLGLYNEAWDSYRHKGERVANHFVLIRICKTVH